MKKVLSWKKARLLSLREGRHRQTPVHRMWQVWFLYLAVRQRYDWLSMMISVQRGRFRRVQRQLPVRDGCASRRLHRRDVDCMSSCLCQVAQRLVLLGRLRASQPTMSYHATWPQFHGHSAHSASVHCLLQATKVLRSVSVRDTRCTYV